jgi:hypothetical protein
VLSVNDFKVTRSGGADQQASPGAAER